MGQRIAVIGAGPMGLAVAYQLALDGQKPVVFEADDRIGGTNAMFDFNGTNIERFYHFFCTSDDAFFQVLDELGLSEKLHWKETKMGYWYQNRIQLWGNPIGLLMFKGMGIIGKLRYGLHAFISTKRTDWQSLDKVEASNWVKKWVGGEAYDIFWQGLFTLKFYDFAHDISAAWIWSRIRRLGLSRYDLFREKLGYLEGHSETFLYGMKNVIEERGGIFRLSSAITKVVIKENVVKGIEIAGKFEAFDKIISTIPLPIVTKMIPDLPDEIMHAYRSIKNIAVVCVIVKLKRPLSKYFWVNINDPEMDIPGLVELSNLYPFKEHIVYVPYYIPGDHPKYHEDDQAFINKVQKYMKKINPNLSNEDFLDMHVSRYRYAQPICFPGFLEKLPPIALSIKGLWVADTSYYYPEDRGISESIQLGRKIAKMAEID